MKNLFAGRAQASVSAVNVKRNMTVISTCFQAQQIAKIKVIRYSQSPFFANKESIQKMMVDLLREIKSARKNTNAQQDNGGNCLPRLEQL